MKIKEQKTKSKIIKVTADSNGQRLDIFLSEKLKISRSQAQKMIGEDRILVNDAVAKKTGYAVKNGDKLVILQTKSSNILIIQSSKSIKPTKTERLKDCKIDIVASTPDYLVVNKPTGMLTHSTSQNELDSLAAILLQKYPELKTVRDLPLPPPSKGGDRHHPTDTNRPGIVHRLDKEASGLLVVARTQPMFDHLKAQFKNRTIDKEYSVLVHGRVSKDWSEITFPIARGEHDKMVALPQTVKGVDREQGKQAHTEFWVEKRFTNFTLLTVKIHTGRMHQIRVHMLAYNHPVVGDPMYFQKKRPNKWDAKLGRLFLHCTHLGFTDLAGDKQEFNSPLPNNLENFLKLLH